MTFLNWIHRRPWVVWAFGTVFGVAGILLDHFI